MNESVAQSCVECNLVQLCRASQRFSLTRPSAACCQAAHHELPLDAARLCSGYNELLQGSNGMEGETTSSIDLASVVVFSARVQLLFSQAQEHEAKRGNDHSAFS